jgi:hypothetical protein
MDILTFVLWVVGAFSVIICLIFSREHAKKAGRKVGASAIPRDLSNLFVAQDDFYRYITNLDDMQNDMAAKEKAAGKKPVI